MDMKKMIQRMTDLENEAKQQKLTESNQLVECPPMEGGAMPAAPMDQGDPVRMNVNISAAGKDHVADLLAMMKAAGLDDAKPAADAMLPMRMDMERLKGIMDEPEMEADAAYADAAEDELEAEEGYDNEPDPEYQDHKYMTKDLSGGINREKKAYKAAQDGDNAMAVEAIKAQLMAALAEKKAKPDFLDMDKDGNKKEPMKKAIADKKKKGPVKEDQAGGYPKKHVEHGLKLYRKLKKDGALNSEAEGYVAYIAQKKLGFSEIEADKFAEYIADRDISLDYASGPRSDLDRENMHGALKKALAKEDQVGEISGDLAKRYTKNAKVDRDNTDHILKRDGSTNDWKANQELQKRNAKRTKGINRAAKRMEK